MEDFNQDFVYAFNSDSLGFPDSPTLGIGKTHDATQVKNIANWLQESTLQSISPSPDGYEEGKVFTSLDNAGGRDFLSRSVQEAGITSEFPKSVDEFNLDLNDLMNHATPSPIRSSFNDTAEVMEIQAATTPCNENFFSIDHDMMSPGSSSPKVLTVSSHPQYLDLPGPNSVESNSSAASNIQGAVKSARKQRRRTREPKKKLYEREEPFEDPIEERKRLNAIKAHRNRQKKGGFFSELIEENNKLKQSIAERDQLIAQLKQTIIDINNTHSSHAAKLDQIRKIVL